LSTEFYEQLQQQRQQASMTTQAPENDSDSPKGKPLTDANETLTTQMSASFSEQTNENGQNEPRGEDLPGLLCTSTPDLKLPNQKDRASQSLTDWEYQTHSPKEWVARLDAGKTIAIGHFVKGRKENYTDENGEVHERWVGDENGEYTHASESWKSTRLIFTDADIFRDENDNAPAPFSDPNKLFELYPSLPKEAYSIGHSISSLSNEKPPPHVRARVSFLLENRIADPDDYDALLKGLAHDYPIISTGRQPAQPVFGNAGWRRKYDAEKDKVLIEKSRFSTKIFGNVISKERADELIESGKQAEEAPSRRATTQSAATNTNGENPTPDQMREILSFIKPDKYPQEWFPVGCALYRAGYDFEVWDTWSQKSVKYKPKGMRKKWKSFAKESQKSKESPITIATIYHLAMKNGWQPPTKQQYRHGYHTHRNIYRRRYYR